MIFKILFRCLKCTLRLQQSNKFNLIYQNMIEQPKEESRDDHEPTRIYYSQTSQQLQYFVPACITLNFQSIQKINLQSFQAQVTAKFIIKVYYGSLSQQIVEKIKEKFEIAVNQENKIVLSKFDQLCEIIDRPSKKEIYFYYRNRFYLKIQGSLLWIPFQKMDAKISLEISKVKIQNDVTKTVIVNFNILKPQEENIPMTFSGRKTFGDHKLALGVAQYQSSFKKNAFKEQQYIDIAYQLVNKQLNNENNEEHQPLKKKSKKAQVQALCYAHFMVPIFQVPTVMTLTIFIPLFLLSMLNLAIFFQGNDVGKRVLNIATMFLGYAAFAPTIRTMIPPTPSITIIQILIYILYVTSLICLFQSINISQGYDIIWRQDPYFIITIIITGLIFLILVIIFILYEAFWKPSYQLQKKKGIDIQTVSWNQWKSDDIIKIFKSFKCIEPVIKEKRQKYPSEIREQDIKLQFS